MMLLIMFLHKLVTLVAVTDDGADADDAGDDDDNDNGDADADGDDGASESDDDDDNGNGDDEGESGYVDLVSLAFHRSSAVID